jgi:hypothetical protein
LDYLGWHVGWVDFVRLFEDESFQPNLPFSMATDAHKMRPRANFVFSFVPINPITTFPPSLRRRYGRQQQQIEARSRIPGEAIARHAYKKRDLTANPAGLRRANEANAAHIKPLNPLQRIAMNPPQTHHGLVQATKGAGKVFLALYTYA